MATAALSPSQQLDQELRGAVARAIASRRPILTHVNADTTWLLQIPTPTGRSLPSGRLHFNILIDPWLRGPQSDVAAWFSTQWHSIPSSVQSIRELEERLREIEEISRDVSPSHFKSTKLPETSFIDAVAICHEFTDHCHEATLREIDPAVPVFAVDLAAKLIRSWNHFKDVQTMLSFTPDKPDWRTMSVASLPDWLGISRVTSPGNALYYHSALLITMKPAVPPPQWPADAAEAVIYTPHGIAASDLAHVAAATPPIRTLALLHGLHDVSLPRFQLNLGAHSGLQAHRAVRPRYWVASHDEHKKGGGLVGFFLRRAVVPLSDALEKVRSEAAEQEENLDWLKDVNFMDMQSGESLLLV